MLLAVVGRLVAYRSLRHMAVFEPLIGLLLYVSR